MTSTQAIPRAFIWRRLHSLMGLWLVLFLMEHLLTNSQAALLLGDNGQGFVRLVNSLHNLPYLQAIEIVLLGVPILIHLIWGIRYLFTAKLNSGRTDGSAPSLPEYSRNHAYTWQRITSWILVFGLIGHVVKFRFLDYPDSINQGNRSAYFVRVSMDDGLYAVADRLGAVLYDGAAIEKEKQKLQGRGDEQALIEARESLKEQVSSGYDNQKAVIFTSAQKFEDKKRWVEKLSAKKIGASEVIAVSDNFGTASLLSVRDTFKYPIYVGLYTIFVLASCFHAFNGLWTFLITWGVVLRMSAQKWTVTLTTLLMLLITFLGLISIWGTYWLNLKH